MYVSNYHIATVHVALGDVDEAFRRLRLALDDLADWRLYLKVDPRFARLHRDPRFAELVGRLGL